MKSVNNLKNYHIKSAGFCIRIVTYTKQFYSVCLKTMQYTTISTLRSYLWLVVDAVQDSLLDSVIKRCTHQFDKYLGRNLTTTLYTEYLSVDGDSLLIVDKWPVNSIVALKYDDENGATITHKRIDGNIIYLTGDYTGTIYVRYIGWYTTIEDILDVEQACLEVCKDLWDNTPASWNEANIKSKQIETLSKTYFSKQEMSAGIGVSFREALDNYKIFNPMII